MLYVLCDPLSGNSAHTTLEYSFLIDILPNWPLPHSKVFILDGHVGPYCTQKC